MSLQRYARGTLRHALDVHWRCVKEVDTMPNGVIHQFVHPVLVYDIPLSLWIGDCGPAHAAIAEQRYLVLAQSRETAIGHLVCGNRSKFPCPTLLFCSCIASCQSGRSGGQTHYLQKFTSIHSVFYPFIKLSCECRVPQHKWH